MDSSEKIRFSGIVYARRNHKNNKKGVSPATSAAEETAVAAAEVTAPKTTKVSKSAELPEKVVAQTRDYLLTDNSISGNVPDGGAVIVGLERRFSGKVYSRRNRTTQDLPIATSTSGNVPDGGGKS